MTITRVTRVAMIVAGVLWGHSAWAQSAYIGGAIRVGTFLTEHVGVELEYFRPGELESDGGGPFYPAVAGGGITVSDFYRVDPSLPTDLIYPPIISQSMRVRTSTTSALLTARQPLGGRIELVYLGGIGFSRVVRSVEYGFPRALFPVDPRLQSSYSTRTTQYGTGPVVGVEVRAGMTEHAQLVAGLRVHALGQSLVDGWMIRPSVGLAWKF
jgi:hypothetical protein